MSVLADSGKSLKFAVGTTHAGEIVGIREQQARDFNTKIPKTFKDGNPIMEAVLTVREADGNEGDLYVSSKILREAVTTARRAAGASVISVGDSISVTCTGIDASNNNAKQYTVSYSVFDPTV